jgi:hypothetical protein
MEFDLLKIFSSLFPLECLIVVLWRAQIVWEWERKQVWISGKSINELGSECEEKKIRRYKSRRDKRNLTTSKK